MHRVVFYLAPAEQNHECVEEGCSHASLGNFSRVVGVFCSMGQTDGWDTEEVGHGAQEDHAKDREDRAACSMALRKHGLHGE